MYYDVTHLLFPCVRCWIPSGTRCNTLWSHHCHEPSTAMWRYILSWTSALGWHAAFSLFSSVVWRSRLFPWFDEMCIACWAANIANGLCHFVKKSQLIWINGSINTKTPRSWPSFLPWLTRLVLQSMKIINSSRSEIDLNFICMVWYL